MIAPDANLLIFASNPSSPFYIGSRVWLEDILSSPELVGFPILSIYAFLRFVTNRTLAPKAISFREGAAIVDTWLALPHVRALYPGHRHWQILQQLSKGVRLSGNVMTDASIAAIAQE